MAFLFPRFLGALAAVCLVASLLGGCGGQDGKGSDDFLLRVDDLSISREEFNAVLDITKSAYPYEALKDQKVVREIKTQLLKQLTEELILTKRAKELGIEVSEEELEKAVDRIKADYPSDAFAEAFLENAITLDMWKERLKTAMLIEKVINRELVEKVRITPEEAAEYYRKHSGKSAKKMEGGYEDVPDVALLKQLRREKAQQAYPAWINRIQKNYHIELNEKAWKEIAG